MNPMKQRNLSSRRALAGAAALALLAAAAAARDGDERDDAPPAAARSAAAPSRLIELALCLDTSGSMNGLIDAARQKLWAIVNDLALAEPTPRLRVALLTFGNDGHPADGGWVRIDASFTEDLDLVSQQLFALTTNGGTELVGRVLSTAEASLDWSARDDVLKLVVVAGNESADQDQVVRYPDACRRLVERGIVVNAIYCGNPADEIAPGWRQVAQLADGHYAAIDQDHGTVVITTPFDAELAALSSAVNATYLPFGAGGEAKWENQRRQDANAEQCSPAVAASRANTKACTLYTCDWDLVEQVKQGKLELEKVAKEELPEKMRELTPEQQRACIEEAWTTRTRLQQKIQAVSRQRDAYVADEMKKQGMEESSAFDRAVRDALRAQARGKGLEFPQPEPAPAAAPKRAPQPPRGIHVP